MNTQRYPAFVTWEVNSTCNHNCIFCYNYNQKEYAQESYSDKNFHRISDFIVSQKPINVTISGGEVLLLFKQIKPHIDKMLSHGIGVRLFTNGSLITEEIAQYCSQNDIHLMVSFPDADRVKFSKITGCDISYDRVLNGLHLLKKYGAVFQPNIVVTAETLETLSDTILFLEREFSPVGIFVSRATKPSNAMPGFEAQLLNNQQLQQMFDICVRLKKDCNITIKTCGGFPLCAFSSQEAFEIFGKVCGAGNMDFVITSTGDVRVCTRDHHIYGNIFIDKFSDIRKKMAIWKQYAPPVECHHCNAVSVCKGGCHMASVEPDRNPGSLDLNSNPVNTPIYFKRKPSYRSARLFRTYTVMPFFVTEDHGEARISHGISYDYFHLDIVDLLGRKRKISVWDIKHELGISYSAAVMITNQLLRIQAIK